MEHQIEDDCANESPEFLSIFSILFFKTYFIASKLQIYIPERITLLNCQYNVF